MASWLRSGASSKAVARSGAEGGPRKEEEHPRPQAFEQAVAGLLFLHSSGVFTHFMMEGGSPGFGTSVLQVPRGALPPTPNPGLIEVARESLQILSNGSALLLVEVQVFVSNVFNVDILRYCVSLVLLLRLTWLDTRLAWNASVYSRYLRPVVTLPWNSSHLGSPSRSRIMRNPIVAVPLGLGLWASSSLEALVDWQDQNPQARVDPDGNVELYLALTTETNCDLELLRLPLDKSDCSLSFYALSNTVTELDFAHAVNEIVKREYRVRVLTTQVPPMRLTPCFQVTNRALKTIIALLVPGEVLLLADVCVGPLSAGLLLGYLVFHFSLVLPSSSSCSPLLIYYFTALLFLSTGETVLLAWLQGRVSGGGQGRAKGSGRSWAEAADRIIFLAYVAGVVRSQVFFASVWMWAVCKSDSPPGEAMPHGGQPRL
ncbi:LOW QUALITY PROTEIN: ligand-gated cation channel ZACN [Rhynchocyon petersi]